MRILHVTDCYLPRLGGIEMHVSDLAGRQQASGHDVVVVTREAGDHAGPVPVERLRCGSLALGAGASIRRLVAERRIEVVQVHLSVVSPLAWSALRSLGNVPVVATVHSVLPAAPEVLRSFMRLTGLRHQAVVLTAVSEAAAAPWRAAVGDTTPVSVLHNGIDPSAWSTSGRRRNPSVFTLVSVGRLARRKRQIALVQVLADVQHRLPEGIVLRAVLVGDGPQSGRVRDAVARAGLTGHVELPGTMTREQIRAVLAEADVYAAPATLESFGIAALEARCAGVPVVAMSQGGAGEFVEHGREGFLVPDYAAMVDVLMVLATDPALRERIARHNATTVPTMAWPTVLAQHDAVYARAQMRAPLSTRIQRLQSVEHSR